MEKVGCKYRRISRIEGKPRREKRTSASLYPHQPAQICWGSWPLATPHPGYSPFGTSLSPSTSGPFLTIQTSGRPPVPALTLLNFSHPITDPCIGPARTLVWLPLTHSSQWQGLWCMLVCLTAEEAHTITGEHIYTHWHTHTFSHTNSNSCRDTHSNTDAHTLIYTHTHTPCLKKWMNEMLAHHQLHILDFTCLDLCPRGDQAGCWKEKDSWVLTMLWFALWPWPPLSLQPRPVSQGVDHMSTSCWQMCS